MKKGFTLTEVLVSLFVIAIITAVSIPVFTRALIKNKAAANMPWIWINNSAVSNFTANSALVIGANSLPANNTPKLLINTTSNNMDHIAFYNNDSKSGRLNVNDKGCFLGNFRNTLIGEVALPANDLGGDEGIRPGLNSDYNNVVAIGNISQCGSNSVVIGNRTCVGENSVAIGYIANAAGNNSVAIGANSYAAEEAIAIGTEAHASKLRSCSIGAVTNAAANYSFVLGDNSISTGEGTIVIGSNSNVEVANSIVIGHGTNIPVSQTFYYSSIAYRSYANSVVLGNPNMNIVLLRDAYVPKSLWVYNVVVTTASATTDPNSLSDSRLKNLQTEYTSGIDKLNRIKVYNYTFKNNPKDRVVGVIAQELIKIFPDAVSKDDKGYYTIRKEDIFYAMVNAFKEFDKKLKAIAEDISNLNKLTVSLDAKIKKLEKQTFKNIDDIEKLKKEINSLEGVNKDKMRNSY